MSDGSYGEMKTKSVRFYALNILVYGFLAGFAPFIFSMGLKRGYTEGALGMCVAAQMLCIMLGNIVWGRISDRLRTNRKTLMAACVMSVMLHAAVYMSRSFAAFFVLYCVTGFAFGTPGILLDSWMLREVHYDMDLYRKIRSGGALGYGVFILIAGSVIEAFGFFAGLILSAATAFTGVALAAFTEESPFEGVKARAVGERTGEKPAGERTVPAAYVLWLVLLFLVGTAMAPANNMKIVILERVGGAQGAQGLDGFLGCMMQAVMFFAAAAFRGFSPKARMLVVSLAVVLGLFLYLSADSVLFIYVGTMLLYGVFSLVNPGSREVVAAYIDQDYQTTATSICDTCYSHISAMAAMFASGWIMDRAGVGVMLMICMTIAFLAAAVSLLTMREGGNLENDRNRAKRVHSGRRGKLRRAGRMNKTN